MAKESGADVLMLRVGLLFVATVGLVGISTGQTLPDKAFEKGEIHYGVTFPGNNEGEPHEVRLTWDQSAVKEWAKWPKITLTRVFIGNDKLEFVGEDSVRFFRGRDLDFPGNPKYQIVARKPSMGLGLLVKGFPVVRKEGDRLVEAADSSRENPFTHWSFEGTVQAGAGTVARVATMVGNGQADSTQRFEVFDAKLGSLPEGVSVVPNWYRAGMKIYDQRVSPPVGWTYERLVAASGKKAGLTPDELFVLSQQLASEIRRDLEAKKAKNEQENRAAVAALKIPLLAFVGVFCTGGLFTLGRQRFDRRSS